MGGMDDDEKRMRAMGTPNRVYPSPAAVHIGVNRSVPCVLNLAEKSIHTMTWRRLVHAAAAACGSVRVRTPGTATAASVRIKIRGCGFVVQWKECLIYGRVNGVRQDQRRRFEGERMCVLAKCAEGATEVGQSRLIERGNWSSIYSYLELRGMSTQQSTTNWIDHTKDQRPS